MADDGVEREIEDLPAKIQLLLSFNIFLLVIFSQNVFSQNLDINGIYSSPSIEDFLNLDEESIQEYEKRLAKLKENTFVDKGANFYQKPSLYFTEAGKKELFEVTRQLMDVYSEYDRMIFIGRSGTGIKNYLTGAVSSNNLVNNKISELPFSFGHKRGMTDLEFMGLKKHLGQNGIDPELLIKGNRPVLFVDFVYSGTGVSKLFEAIFKWGVELWGENSPKLSQLKSKINFFGFYPAELLAKMHYRGLYHDMVGELSGQVPEYTAEQLKADMKKMKMPGEVKIKEYVGFIKEYQISTDFYTYAGTHGHNVQSSFVPDLWADGIQGNSLTLKGNYNGPAFLETYALFKNGRKDSKIVLGKSVCNSLLSK